MDTEFELGLYTFGDLMPEAQAGNKVGARQRLAEIIAAAKLAEASGLDVFAVGEHHRLDMVVSATPVVLAAIAAVTERIRLASAVTILEHRGSGHCLRGFRHRGSDLGRARRDHRGSRHFHRIVSAVRLRGCRL